MEWIITLVVAVITAGGGFIGGIAAMRKAAADERTARDMERQAFIDQVQEERDAAHQLLHQEREEYASQLAAERKLIREEREAYTSRLDTMWTDKAASREHVAELRDHIWQRKPPPPPEPPPGYIH
jgi:flagellar biosynthesis GTPase FlhF